MKALSKFKTLPDRSCYVTYITERGYTITVKGFFDTLTGTFMNPAMESLSNVRSWSYSKPERWRPRITPQMLSRAREKIRTRVKVFS